jgi:nitroreductase
MNEVIKQLYDRKSVRVFEDRPIDEAIIQEILRASAMAPTAGNQQLYTIIRVTDQALLDRLAESCDHQPFIAKAKLVLVYCADCLKWYKAFSSLGCKPRRPGPGDLLLAVDDALIAAQNAVVAAESYGIGSCYIGDIMENIETQREILGLSDLVFPAAMLVFGYPTQQQKDREKPARIGMEHLVFENRYPEADEAWLKAMFSKGRSEEEYRNWMTAFCKRKYNSDFAREMSRSVREYLRQYGE